MLWTPIVLLVAIAGSSAVPFAPAESGDASPSAIPTGFFVDTVSGHGTVALFEPGARARAHAVLFVSGAPSDARAATWRDLVETYQEEGFRFLVIAREAAAAEAWQRTMAELPGAEPVGVDPLAAAARICGVERDGTALLVDDLGRVLYRGALDEVESASGDVWLVDALEGVLMEEPPAAETSWAVSSAAELPPVIDEGDVGAQVLRSIEQHCVECHQPGRIGPMSFVDPHEVQGWAAMIAEVVDQHRMPPWNADPRTGPFVNQRVLTSTERERFVRWAQSGAVLPADVTPLDTGDGGASEWEIGEPDLVIELAQDEEIAATGVEPYRYRMVDPGFTEDRWVQAVEIRPTAPEVTHHVLVYLLPEGVAMRDFFRNQRQLGEGLLAGVAPGNPPDFYPEGVARRIPAGSRFLFQLHYTPNGSPARDRSRVGLRFARAAVVQEIQTYGITNFRIDIPPHEPAAAFQARHRLREDVTLVGMTPHLHSRGKSFRYELVRGDGSEQLLLNVPAYDFNWQHNYDLIEPLELEAGDAFLLTAVFDNSAENPFNPDPDARVRWGDQTFEEMFLGWIHYRIPVEASGNR